MIVHASNLPLSLDAALAGNEPMLHCEIARSLGVKAGAVLGARLIKRSVDARKKANVHFVATFEVELAGEPKLRPAKGVNVSEPKLYPVLDIKQVGPNFEASGQPRPVVVGTGPAGLFCALYLARAGMRPLVVERGSSVGDRVAAIEAFNAGGALDVSTNIQFGEGGAGTFSDGKLNTGTKSPHIRHVLEEFVAAGAPKEILWQAKPHIGTDRLIDVVRKLRLSIIEAGGEVRFNTLMESVELDTSGHCVRALVLRDLKTGQASTFAANRVVLACGHSARDTFRMVHEAGFVMERKPFAVGVRIEHPQSFINQSQYGAAHEHPALGAADYKLAVHTCAGRGVYTFCMCPGGEVVAAASEEGGVCVNGMSRFARDGQNANSALLVGVEPSDFPGNDVLAGLEFQRGLERAAFELGGRSYRAPAQTVGDFLSGEAKPPKGGSFVSPTYPRGVVWRDLHQCLPDFVTEAMEEALPLLDRKLAGFAHPQAVMTAVEARSSSPVRIVRDESFQAAVGLAFSCELGSAVAPERASAAPKLAEAAPEPAAATPKPAAATPKPAEAAPEPAAATPNFTDMPPKKSGLYPCGEGAGYAGGITSAAVDGLRVAEAIVAEFSDVACGHAS